MIEMVTGWIKPVLLILIPFCWVLGMWLKKAVAYEGDGRVMKLLKRILGSTSRIKGALYVLVVLVAVLIGFVFSNLEGGRRVGEAVIVYGIHGAVCVWISTRLYDKVRAQ